jgi:CRP/FNR family transcriptional regulator, cyclic AMP receptor protein
MSDINDLYIFEGFSDTEISFFLLMSQTQYRKAGERIMTIWEESNGCAYYVTRGAVQVTQGGEVVANLGPGSFFWEVALITDEARNATIDTIEDTELQVFLKDDFLTLMKRGAHGDEMRTEMLRRIMERVKQ